MPFSLFEPYCIQPLAQPEQIYTQPFTHGVDTGSAVIGSVGSDERGSVVYLSEVQIRNDIAETMKQRARSRRNRRNRKNSIKQGRFSPTMKSKIDAHLTERRKYRKSLLKRCRYAAGSPSFRVILEKSCCEDTSHSGRGNCPCTPFSP